MKKKNWLMTIAFAVLALTIVSTCVIGSTYAKFTQNVTGGAEVQAAGFLVAGSETPVTVTGLLAPEVTLTASNVQITYFSQVETLITVAEHLTYTGDGIFAEWDALLAAYNALWGENGSEQGHANADFTYSLEDILTITASVGAGNASADLAEAFVDAVVANKPNGSTVAKKGTSTTTDKHTLTAMASTETTAATASFNVQVKWNNTYEADETLRNRFDTFVGNAIYRNLTTATYGATVGASHITVTLPITATQVVAQG